MDERSSSRTWLVLAAVVAGIFAIGAIISFQGANGAGSGGSSIPIRTIAILSVISILLVAMIGGVTLRSRMKSRTPKLRIPDVATSLGLEYTEKADAGFGATIKGIPRISWKATNQHVIRGWVAERAFMAFENYYMVYTGHATIPVHHTVLTLGAPGDWGTVQVVPRNAMSRFTHRLGVGRGLQLDSDQFNSTFKVDTDNESFAIVLLSQAMQAFLLEKPSVAWRVEPGRISLVYRGKMRADRLEQAMQRLAQFWAHVPDVMR